MSILQAAEKLHADARVLEALEAERFEELGAAVFVRGHIRRYAELVREQPQELQDMYAASSHAVARPDLTRIPTTGSGRPQDPGKLIVPGLIFVIAVGLIGVVWWFLTSLRTPSPPVTAKSVDGGVITEPAQTDGSSDEPASVDSESGVTPSSSSGAPSSTGARTNATQARGPALAASSGSRPATTPATTAPPAAAMGAIPASPGEAPPPPAGGKPTEVTLHFSGDSWAEVYDAKGTKLFYDIGAAGAVKTLSGTPPLRVILGNPNGVALEVNGKAATLPQIAGAENGIQFSLNRSGRVSRARATPTGQ
jgi:cytoskeleton protein RodZ